MWQPRGVEAVCEPARQVPFRQFTPSQTLSALSPSSAANSHQHRFSIHCTGITLEVHFQQFRRLFSSSSAPRSLPNLRPSIVMPASVPFSPESKSVETKSHVRSQPRKTRIVRRRGRAKNAIESDDEIEREVGTDSDPEDDQSSFDSDSDAESISRRSPANGRSHISTPSTTQSPEERTPPDDEVSSKLAISNSAEVSFFGTTGNWSEMVTDENVNGPADLPVIDFGDLEKHGIDQLPRSTPRSRKKVKAGKKPTVARPALATAPAPTPSAPPSVAEDSPEPENNGHVASSSRQSREGHFPRREIGQTARQAYQQRLESDPSYVPTVGEFWGHDDRLLDKDLRSLSGWWRGRWQGRARGRGFFRGFPARGRGNSIASASTVPPEEAAEGSAGEDEAWAVQSQVAPIEQPWTHDGFEEMKRKEEHNSTSDASHPKPSRGVGSFRGGRGFGRGRGGFSRGGFSPSPSKSRSGLPYVLSPGKTWFSMKPERVWTKQHDAFLYFDPALKPRPGQGPGYRVKMPGDRAQIIRAPASSPANPVPTKPSTGSVLGSEDGEKPFVVRLPKREDKKNARATAGMNHVGKESVRTVEEPPIDDVFVVRPQRAGKLAPPPINPPAANGSPLEVRKQLSAPAFLPSNSYSSTTSVHMAQQQLEQISIEPSTSDPTSSLRWAQTEEAVLRNPSTEARTETQQATVNGHSRPSHAVLPPLQTAFTPVSQPSPSFTSHYAYGPALPPGIAVNQHGMPYELATGRAVYLQPPPPMYNHRPLMPSHMAPQAMPFVPGHLHHHSTVSPDFLSQPSPHSPPVNGFTDSSVGSAMFSLPRSSRIEIRAPADASDGKSGKPFVHRPSGLRTASPASEPPNSIADAAGQGYFLDVATGVSSGEGGREDVQVAQSAMMPYPVYQHPYYYPEPYGYTAYMDVPQVPSYEMYPTDLRAPPQAVYY